MAPKKKARGAATFIDRTRFRLVEPLRLDVSPEKTREWDEVLMTEALYRGASEFDIVWRLERRLAREQSQVVPLGFDPLGLPADTSVLRQVSAELKERAERELRSFPDWVQESFKFDMKVKEEEAKAKRRPPEPAWPPLEYYILMRGVLYQHGYDDPAEAVFRRITSAKLLDRPIECGVHHLVKDRLSNLEPLLESWQPGLAAQTAKQIKRASGFVPRFIARRQGQKGPASLSYHSFGLAIDIDFAWNPHIKDRDVIAAIREATGYDFGKPFIETEQSIEKAERIRQIHAEATRASDALKAWLCKWLPVYKELYAEIEKRERAARASLPDLVDPETYRNLQLLATVTKFHKVKELETWAQHGVLSLPIAFVAAMAELGFRWGGEYEGSKDTMHFELLPHQVLPPDTAKKRLPEEVLQMLAP